MIYAISAIGRIKIGTSNDVEKRFAELQRETSVPLFLLGTAEGGFELESDIHIKLAPFALIGELGVEWYVDCPLVRQEIKNIFAGRFEKIEYAPAEMARTGYVDALLARARRLWPRRTALALMSITGAPERTCYNWLSGKVQMLGEAALALSDALDRAEIDAANRADRREAA